MTLKRVPLNGLTTTACRYVVGPGVRGVKAKHPAEPAERR